MKRGILKLGILPLVGLLLTGASAAAADRPNIVFIFSDDHAYQAINAYGDPRKLIETPNIDRIAREGVRFDRTLVPNSICGPSRASILTGKYSHRNGFYNNTHSRFDGSQVTFPKLLQKAGYQTAVIGKWHLVTDPTGFDHWHILPGQGRYYNPSMIRDGKPVQHPGYVTDLIADFSVEWIKKRDRSKPFLLLSHHKAPHREWSPALRHLGHDNDRRYPEPETLFEDYSKRGVAVREQDMTLAKTFTAQDAKLVPPPGIGPEQLKLWNAYYEPRNAAFREAKLDGQELVRWRYNRYLHDYLGCVRAVDEAVGKLLKCLDEEGLTENTLVVYSSDQGFFLGEHGWFDKRWVFEESLRTPLLIRWPGVAKAGHVVPEITSVLDLAQTFLEAAGVPADPEMQGASLLPLLKGHKPQDWRTSFYYEYFEYPTPHRVMPHYGVVTDRYKLVRFYVPRAEGKPDPDYWELYDRQKDPRETQDFYRDPAYAATVRQLRDELDRLRKELKVPEETPREAFGTLFLPPKKKKD
jgi:arylsulfatase A-like enzyme